MTVAEALAVVAAGVAAGTVNTLVGSGTLVTFPVLLSLGYSPIVANVSNTIGLVTGSAAGAVGYRRELAGQGARMARLVPASLLGGLGGAVALLLLPDEAFNAIVPLFILAAVVLVLLQPRLSERIARDRPRGAERSAWLWLAIFGTGLYGGYFGAAQGILLVAIMGAAIADDLQRLNGLKNVLAGLVNLIAGIVFLLATDVAWTPVGLIAAGSLVGGILGARYGRRLSPVALRVLIVIVGTISIVRLLG